MTTVLEMSLAEASVKMRQGPPADGDGPDAGLDVWAGEIPLANPAARPGGRSDPPIRHRASRATWPQDAWLPGGRPPPNPRLGRKGSAGPS